MIGRGWVFNIDIEVCDICGKKVKVIASIEEFVVIKKILAHLKEQTPATIKFVKICNTRRQVSTIK